MPEGTIPVGLAIKYFRERKGWSARKLSEKAKLSPSYVGKVESGEIEPSLRAFARIAMALQMTSAEINFLVCQQACVSHPQGMVEPA